MIHYSEESKEKYKVTIGESGSEISFDILVFIHKSDSLSHINLSTCTKNFTGNQSKIDRKWHFETMNRILRIPEINNSCQFYKHQKRHNKCLCSTLPPLFMGHYLSSSPVTVKWFRKWKFFYIFYYSTTVFYRFFWFLRDWIQSRTNGAFASLEKSFAWCSYGVWFVWNSFV